MSTAAIRGVVVISLAVSLHVLSCKKPDPAATPKRAHTPQATAGAPVPADASSASTPAPTPAPPSTAAPAPPVALPAATDLPEDGVAEAQEMTIGASADAPKPVEIKTIHRQGQTTLAELFQRELAAATAARKGVVVMFGADWCAPCKVLKDFLASSAVVQAAAQRGHLLYIDVDEWRGPAHQLIKGANPRSLPMMVRADERGQAVQIAMGSSFGLLSEAATAQNLARFIGGEAPERPEYMDDAEQRTELLRSQASRRRAALDGVQPFEVEVMARRETGDGQVEITLRLLIRNLVQRRRWCVLPTTATAPTKPLSITHHAAHRFGEHVRANFTRFRTAEASYDIIPLAGDGYVHLRGWTTTVAKHATALEVWILDSASFDGTKLQFEKKVPYALELERAAVTVPLPVHAPAQPGALRIKVGERFTIAL